MQVLASFAHGPNLPVKLKGTGGSFEELVNIWLPGGVFDTKVGVKARVDVLVGKLEISR